MTTKLTEEAYNKIISWIDRNALKSGYVTELGLRKLISSMKGAYKTDYEN